MSSFVDDLRHLIRIERIFERYLRRGKPPTKEECEAWLKSEGWRPEPMANLMKKWGYDV